MRYRTLKQNSHFIKDNFSLIFQITHTTKKMSLIFFFIAVERVLAQSELAMTSINANNELQLIDPDVYNASYTRTSYVANPCCNVG